MSEDALVNVLMVSEVAQIWGVNPQTVWHHMNRGNFRWRLSESGRALVDRRSVVEFWDEPEQSMLFDVFEVRKKSNERD